MTTRLERLLDSIDPDRTLEEVAGRVDDAFDSFQFESATVTQWDAFRVFLIRFMRHLEATVFQVRAMPEASLDFEWGRCVRLLDQEYGKSGQQTAFELARTGNEGGLYAVLQRLAERIAEEYSGNEVAARVRASAH